MKTPNTDALRFAAEWLRQYDDTHDGGEQTSVAAAVADWLDEQADAKELRAAAAEHGVPVAKIRKLLSASGGKSSALGAATMGVSTSQPVAACATSAGKAQGLTLQLRGCRRQSA